MRTSHEWLITLALLLNTSACEPKPEPREPPPADSYTSGTHQVKIGDVTSTIQTAAVTPDYFLLAHIPLVFGRLFKAPDRDSSAYKVVILTFELWQDRFGSSRDVLGRTIEVDGVPMTIVGVTGSGTIPEGTLLWLPK